MQLRDRNILITGGSSGIGEALAVECATAGARPILLGRRAVELDRVVAHIRSVTGVQALSLVCDVTVEADRHRLGRFLREDVGELSVLVHNAGITMHGPFEDSSPDALRQVMELNFFSVVEVTRVVLPFLKGTAGEKRIALVSTPSGLYGISGRFGYSSSKAAAQAFLESIGHELAPFDIGITIFYPGYVRTALRTSGISASGAPISEAQHGSARSPEEVARLMRRTIERNGRHLFTNLTGRFVFFARVLAPGLLDALIRKKHRES